MPIKGIICPDGQKVDKEDCLTSCRLKDIFPTRRCKAVPLLRRILTEREWNGTASTTQLLTGTRELLLKVTKPYYVHPDKKVPAVVGSNIHNLLHKMLDFNEKGEETLFNEILTGTYDMYDPVTKTLYDYKTWSVYKTKKIIKDKSPDALFEVTLQLNQYRMLLQSTFPDLKIENIAVQVITKEPISIVKDYSLCSPIIRIPVLKDEIISSYFGLKKESLDIALKEDYAPRCTERENWNGKKCQEYCEVRDECIALKERNMKEIDDLIKEYTSIEIKLIQSIKDFFEREDLL